MFVKSKLKSNVYIAEGILWVLLNGVGIKLEIIRQPFVGAVILAGLIHGSVSFIHWMTDAPSNSIDAVVEESEQKAKERKYEPTEPMISEEFKNQPNQRSLQMKQRVEEKEARMLRAALLREHILEQKMNCGQEWDKDEENKDSICLDIRNRLSEDDFDFFDCFENQLFDLEIENELANSSSEDKKSLLVFADKKYFVQLQQSHDKKIEISEIKALFENAISYENTIPVLISVGGFTELSIVLAKKSNTEIISKEDIIEWQNPTRKRSFEQEQEGFYEYLKRKLIAKYGVIPSKKTSITVCLEDMCQCKEEIKEEYLRDYQKIASMLLPEYDISLELVKNEEGLSIFPLIKGIVDKDKKKEILFMLKQPTLTTLHTEEAYHQEDTH